MVLHRPDIDPDANAGSPGPGYTLDPVPRNRRPVLDRLIGASRRFQVHALVEFDVTEAKARIVDADPRVSWTGFVIATIARAVALHPEVNARKAGKPHPHLRSRRHRRDGRTPVAGRRSSTSS